ncbi:MAG: LrgB family protein [Clostridiales Family XIII bacterium]|jgi:predicted murein hydrolase (TIGR00659 family)|nr:LrgB family protein [Clostridiales Family XIII bacterium]
MNDFMIKSLFFGMVVSVLSYMAASAIKKKWKHAALNPLLIAIIIVIAILKFCHISYETYNEGARYLGYLLTPATVCLAIPLYEQLNLLRKNALAIIGGIFVGTATGMASIFAIAKILHLSHAEYVTLLPKSVTTAIGLGISEELGGMVTISVVVIIITGIIGNLFANVVCKVFRIQNPIAKGLAIGTSAHAIGTVKAFEMGEVEGAMSSLAIVIAGILTVVGAPIFSHLL